jgi:glycerol-3-phosphate acyltransferase PlsY
MVIIGHIFPFQLKFKGGKGLSTVFGALLVFQPLWIIYLLISCIIIFPLIRRFTITSLFAFMILPLELFISDYSWQEILFTLTYTVVILYACRSNLKEYIQDKAYQKRKRRSKK